MDDETLRGEVGGSVFQVGLESGVDDGGMDVGEECIEELNVWFVGGGLNEA